MKVLYKTEYFERILYVLEINNKYAMVYLSSGLSKTGHGGNILPFAGINTEQRFSSPVMGYIFKEMFYNTFWKTHKKKLENFPGLLDKMDIIRQTLNNMNELISEKASPDIEDTKEWYNFVKNIDKEIRESYKGMKPFDFLHDKIENIK